jgi:acetoin utilization deacetylase AcuC-like enzyme
MAQFHSPDYVEFLQRINPENQNLFPNEMARYNLGEDCPVFEDLFEFCQLYAGGTIGKYTQLVFMFACHFRETTDREFCL